VQTVDDILDLGEEGLVGIKGIGPTTATRIIEAVGALKVLAAKA